MFRNKKMWVLVWRERAVSGEDLLVRLHSVSRLVASKRARTQICDSVGFVAAGISCFSLANKVAACTQMNQGAVLICKVTSGAKRHQRIYETKRGVCAGISRLEEGSTVCAAVNHNTKTTAHCRRIPSADSHSHTRPA